MGAGFAAPDAPGRTMLAPGMIEIPATVDQIAHASIEAEATAMFTGAAGVSTQPAAFYHNGALQLDALDRGIAHVALADRNAAGCAVLERAAAPAAAFDALYDKAALGFRMHAEEHARATEQPMMTC